MPAGAGAGWPLAVLEEPEAKPGSAALDARALGRRCAANDKAKITAALRGYRNIASYFRGCLMNSETTVSNSSD